MDQDKLDGKGYLGDVVSVRYMSTSQENIIFRVSSFIDIKLASVRDSLLEG